MAESKSTQIIKNCGFLASGTRLLAGYLEEDLNGLSFATSELVRWKMTANNSNRLVRLIAKL